MEEWTLYIVPSESEISTDGVDAWTNVAWLHGSGKEDAENGFEIKEATAELPNGSFDDWNKVGKIWNPWAEGSENFWDTGNKGATTLGDSNTQPTDDTWSGTGQAAKLATKFVGIGSIGKLAAGNMYTGN